MPQRTARALLEEAGTTYAEQAGIKMANKPAPLYRLLVLSVLLSTRIKSDIAVAASHELADFGTPKKMQDATWQQRVDALGRAHYVRYDESTATALGQGAAMLLNDFHGDVRQFRVPDRPAQTRRNLQTVPSLGPVGADIFCREAQAVWPELAPYFDKKALSGAEKLGLPADPQALAEQVDAGETVRLAAALVRVTLEKGLLDRILQPA